MSWSVFDSEWGWSAEALWNDGPGSDIREPGCGGTGSERMCWVVDGGVASARVEPRASAGCGDAADIGAAGGGGTGSEGMCWVVDGGVAVAVVELRASSGCGGVADIGGTECGDGTGIEWIGRETDGGGIVSSEIGVGAASLGGGDVLRPVGACVFGFCIFVGDGEEEGSTACTTGV